MVNKFTKAPYKDELVSKIDEIIDNKQDNLISGTNIKTINNESILGSGNISISASGTSTLSGLSDVTISNPANGQVLEYNGTNWTNANKTTITFREWN